MNKDVLLIADAMQFAAEKHVDDRRKGESEEPYFNHVSEVAWTLARCTEGEDTNLVVAGLLHDTIEDTGTTYEELVDRFGEDVAGLVSEVSDDKRLPKAERKRLQIEKAPSKSERARMLKISDKICNLRSIIETPPADWSDDRKREYFEWAKAVVAGCRGINEALEAEFDRTYGEGARVFGLGA